MGEQPFIKFYPSDFLGGTSGLSPAERGVYITLLCLIYEADGPIKRDDSRLARCCGAPKAAFQRTLEALIDQGKIVEGDGMLSASDIFWRSKLIDPRPSIPADVVADVMSEKVCRYCGSCDGPFEIDHIHPWSRGGTHDRINLALACRSCNRSKGAKTVEEWRGAVQ